MRVGEGKGRVHGHTCTIHTQVKEVGVQFTHMYVLHPYMTCRRSKNSKHKLGTSCSTWTLKKRWQVLLMV